MQWKQSHYTLFTTSRGPFLLVLLAGFSWMQLL
jgi:hypothetical protein